MTTDISDDVLSFLEKWVVQDGKPVTARLLAVQQQISMRSARAHMQRLLDQRAKAQSSEGKPYALWMLSGSIGSEQLRLDHDDDEDEEDGGDANAVSEAVLLADDDQLASVKARFVSTPSVCLYSLSPPLASKPTRSHKVAAASQLITIQHDLKNTPEYVMTWHDNERGVLLGAIRPAEDLTFVGNTGSLSAGVVEQKKDAKSQARPAGVAAAVPVKTETAKPRAAGSFFKSTTKQTTADKPAAKAATTGKINPVEDDEEEDEGGPIGYADEASEPVPAIQAKPAAKATVKQKRADAGDKKLTQEERRKLRKQELMDLVDEDHDGNADPDVPVAASTSTSMMGGSAEVEPGKEAARVEAKPKDKRRVRKQRTVTRKETSKDAKGYRVTRDVEDYESYSSFESSEEEDAPTSTKAKSRGAAKGRASRSTKEASQKPKAEADVAMEQSDDEGTNANDAKANEIQGSLEAPPSAQPSSAKKPAPPPAKKPAATAGTTKAAGAQQKLSSFFARKT